MSLGFARIIKKYYLGKVVEIYQGDIHDTRLQAEINNDCKTIICGKVLEVSGEAILLEAITKNGTHLVTINTWSISSVCELNKNILHLQLHYKCIHQL